MPAGFSGNVTGSVDVITKEANTPPATPGSVVAGSGQEHDNGDNTKTDTTNFSFTVNDQVKSPNVAVNLTNDQLVIKEDTTGSFIVTATAGDATDHITVLTFTKLVELQAAGWTVTVTGSGGTVGVYAAGVFTVTGVVTSAQVQVSLKPPLDSDRDVINDVLADITVVATAADNSTPALTANSATKVVDVNVDAVLDQYVDVSGSAIAVVNSNALSQTVGLNLTSAVVGGVGNPFTNSFAGGAADDTDGSEVRPVTAQITVPNTAINLDLSAGFPAGTTITETALNSGIWNLTVTSAANLQSALNHVVAVVPGGFTGAVSGTVSVTTAEANTPAVTPNSKVAGSGQEHDTGDNSKTDTANFNFDVINSDKTPVAYDDKISANEPAPKNANVMLIFDVSGSMNAEAGFGGLTKLEAAKEAAINLLSTMGSNGGDVRVMIVWFNAAAQRQEAWLDIPSAVAAIEAIPASDNGALTNYEAAITAAIAGFNDTDNRGNTATFPGLVYFLSDGEPTTGGNPADNPDADGLTNNGITQGTLDAWDALLELNANNVEKVFSVGLGTAIPGGAGNVNLINVANPNTTADAGDSKTPGDNDPANQVILVDDLNDLSGTLSGTVSVTIIGNVLNGTIEDDIDGPNAGKGNDPDNTGDGGAYLWYFKYDGDDNNQDIVITWDGVNAASVTIDGVANGDGVSKSGDNVSFDTEHGRMTIDLGDGKFTFLAGPVSGGDQSEHFTYKIKDVDGDESNSADLEVKIKDVFQDEQPVAYDNYKTLTESTVPTFSTVEDFNDNTGLTVVKAGSVVIDASGSNEAAISTGSGAVSIATLETNLGLGAGTLSALLTNSPSLTDGSGISQAFTAPANSVLSFVYDYDSPSAGGSNNDASAYFVLKGTTIVAQGIIRTGSDDFTDQTINVPIIAAGNDYKVVFVAVDRGGNGNDTTLDIDNISISTSLNGVSGNVVTDPNNSPAGVSTDPNGLSDIIPNLPSPGAFVSRVVFNGTSVTLPGDGSTVAVNGANGTLFINRTGAYTYVSNPNTVPGGAHEIDAFTYTLRDLDNDFDTGILRINTDGIGASATVTIGNASVNEGGTANIVVTLSEPAPIGGITLNYVLQAGGANPATAGVDFSAIVGQVTVAAGATTANIQVNATADGFNFDPNETYQVVISGAPAGWNITDATGDVTITDIVHTPVNFTTFPNGGWPDSVSGSNFDGNSESGDGDAGEQGWDGEGGNDTLNGFGGDDRLFGEEGNDLLNGGDNDDLLEGGNGDDTLNGGNGNDQLVGGGGFDKYDGGAGDDWLDVDATDLGAGRQIAGGTGNDVLDISGSDLTGSTGITGIEVISMEGGGDQDDVTLSAADVIALSGGTLFIWGDGIGGGGGGTPDDDVALNGGGWSAGATNITGTDGRTYNQFTHAGATVFVDTDVDVALS